MRGKSNQDNQLELEYRKGRSKRKTNRLKAHCAPLESKGFSAKWHFYGGGGGKQKKKNQRQGDNKQN